MDGIQAFRAKPEPEHWATAKALWEVGKVRIVVENRRADRRTIGTQLRFTTGVVEVDSKRYRGSQAAKPHLECGASFSTRRPAGWGKTFILCWERV